jgi:hypothetical protein
LPVDDGCENSSYLRSDEIMPNRFRYLLVLIAPIIAIQWVDARIAAQEPSRGEVTVANPAVTPIEVTRIWDQAPHNAFTDLIFSHGHFFCAFREGRGHVSSDGRIRVLTSKDGNSWQSSALVELADFDLRDAGLSIAPDGRLMLVGGASPRKADGDRAPTGSFVTFSNDGREWSTPQIVVDPGRWLWRITWHKDTGYGVAYAAGTGHPFSALLATNDGIAFRPLVAKLLGDGYPTEATIRFGDQDVAYCLQRRDGTGAKNTAMLGVSEAPYTEWKWSDLGRHFGGPNFIRLPSGRWIAAGRIHRPGGPKTELAWLDVDKHTLTPCLELPSGGDTSYPGLVWHDEHLWVSYYSSHEGKTSIYMAKVAIE